VVGKDEEEDEGDRKGTDRHRVTSSSSSSQACKGGKDNKTYPKCGVRTE